MAAKTSNNAKLDRASADAARLVIEQLLPQTETRRIALSFLTSSINQANNISADAWGITLFKDLVRLNIGNTEAFVIESGAVYVVLDDTSLSDQARRQLKKWGEFGKKGHYRTVPNAIGLRLPTAKLSQAIPLLQDAHTRLIEEAASRRKRTTWYEAHSPGVISYLQSTLSVEIPNPSYVGEIQSLSQQDGAETPELNLPSLLDHWFSSRGLHFTSWQIASFYTALQVKGFVILSGISGTGKTRLAQSFAELLPQPTAEVTATDGAITITLQPYMLKYGRLLLPRQATRLFDLPQMGQTKEVLVTFDGHSQSCRLAHAAYADTDTIQLHLRGAARQWLNKNLTSGDTLLLEPELDADQDLINFRLYTDSPSKAQPKAPPKKPSGQHEKNSLFLSVRPDWRDSKSLLGYYNPLTCCYEWTPLLRFLLRAAQSYRAGDGLAWLVILDEMNLARVEFYLSDLLSVLEAGRDEHGLTREPLRLHYPTEAEGDLPPHELFLPPNIYFIGTVNIDETTHAFSPRVLDRAFTLELRDVDFHNYPSQLADTSALPNEGEKQRVLQAFTSGGTFAQIRKTAVAEYVATHPILRTRLQNLNDLLQPYNLHFGYRVFDEIIAFLAAAEANALLAPTDTVQPLDAAFDAAILMKVLPKFHGSRSKLEAPLHDLLAWCLDADAPDQTAINQISNKMESSNSGITQLRQLPYRYPRTAERVLIMLQALHTDGFAAFGG
ncbi:MAG: hypothetical protein JO316_16300 [Abitibacteriaceae bacterium]|nr:hypothetical protein [Abditibacteriaceae bacterium]MBV9866914.1 hypothetical protein [Abditibacteriaceae bacterium]